MQQANTKAPKERIFHFHLSQRARKAGSNILTSGGDEKDFWLGKKKRPALAFWKLHKNYSTECAQAKQYELLSLITWDDLSPEEQELHKNMQKKFFDMVWTKNVKEQERLHTKHAITLNQWLRDNAFDSDVMLKTQKLMLKPNPQWSMLNGSPQIKSFFAPEFMGRLFSAMTNVDACLRTKPFKNWRKDDGTMFWIKLIAKALNKRTKKVNGEDVPLISDECLKQVLLINWNTILKQNPGMAKNNAKDVVKWWIGDPNQDFLYCQKNFGVIKCFPEEFRKAYRKIENGYAICAKEETTLMMDICSRINEYAKCDALRIHDECFTIFSSRPSNKLLKKIDDIILKAYSDFFPELSEAEVKACWHTEKEIQSEDSSSEKEGTLECTPFISPPQPNEVSTSQPSERVRTKWLIPPNKVVLRLKEALAMRKRKKERFEMNLFSSFRNGQS